VENAVAKVLHATQLKFHARWFFHTTSKALSHFATRARQFSRFGMPLALPKCKHAVKFFPGGFS
jgi:hypothetical protein